MKTDILDREYAQLLAAIQPKVIETEEENGYQNQPDLQLQKL